MKTSEVAEELSVIVKELETILHELPPASGIDHIRWGIKALRVQRKILEFKTKLQFESKKPRLDF